MCRLGEVSFEIIEHNAPPMEIQKRNNLICGKKSLLRQPGIVQEKSNDPSFL